MPARPLLVTVAIVAGLAALRTAALAAPIVPPPGWVEDRALAEPPRDGFEAVHGNVSIRAYRPAGDRTAVLVVMRGFLDWRDPPREIVDDWGDAAVREAGAGNFELVSRDAQEPARMPDQRAFADLVFSGADGGRRHVRVMGASVQRNERVELLVVTCTGTGPAFAACDAQMPTITIAVDPTFTAADDEDSRFWYVLVGLVATAIACGAIVVPLRGATRRKALRSSPPLVDLELVTVIGVVQVVGTPLTSPLSDRRCVVHRSHARLISAAAVPQVVAEPAEAGSVAFVLATAHGPIVVDASALEVALMPRAVIRGRTTPSLQAFLARHGHPAHPHHLATFDEIVVAAGDTISVRGMVKMEVDPTSVAERGYRDDVPVTKRLVAPAGAAVEILRTW